MQHFLQWYNPCANGHIWTWAANSTDIYNSPPSDDYTCQCGEFQWKNKDKITDKNFYPEWMENDKGFQQYKVDLY